MSVRLQKFPAEEVTVSLVQLENLVTLVNERNLVFDVSRFEDGGPFFILHDNVKRETLLKSAEFAAVIGYLDLPAEALSVAVEPLPRKADGGLDTMSTRFRNRRRALHLKSGYSGFDCDKALRKHDGAADNALALLFQTNGFKASKA